MLHVLLETMINIGSLRRGVNLRHFLNKMSSKSINFGSKCTFYHTSVMDRALKKIPFEFVHPERIPAIFTSGDKEKLEIDKNKIQAKFVGSKELEDADEHVRKMCSLQFVSRGEIVAAIKQEYIDRVKRHELDQNSLDTQIARLTSHIRGLQEHVRRVPKRESRGRITLKHAIDKRFKYLTYMKHDDYERFQWILKALNIEYKEPLRYYWYQTRKGALRDMVQNYCDDVRVSRLQALKDKLKSQQADFLKEKEEKLKFIASEEIALGIKSEMEEEVKASDKVNLSEKKPPPIENTMVRIAHTAEGRVVYSVPTWPPRPDDWP